MPNDKKDSSETMKLPIVLLQICSPFAERIS